jgi:hypothetical protein
MSQWHGLFQILSREREGWAGSEESIYYSKLNLLSGALGSKEEREFLHKYKLINFLGGGSRVWT